MVPPPHVAIARARARDARAAAPPIALTLYYRSYALACAFLSYLLPGLRLRLGPPAAVGHVAAVTIIVGRADLVTIIVTWIPVAAPKRTTKLD